MKEVFEKIRKKIMLLSTEACAYRENTRVISEAELKEILEVIEKEFVTDKNVGNNDWIPVKERLPECDKNVRVTAVSNIGKVGLAIGWYNNFTKRWTVCFDEDDNFYRGEVVAWKENTDEPYQPKGDVPD